MMIGTIFTAFIYLFETLASLIYYDNLFNKKVNKLLFFGFYFSTFVILYGISFVTIPILNMVSFFICFLTISLVCYKTDIKSAIFSTAMLTIFMFSTELIVVSFSSIIFSIDFMAYVDNSMVLIIQSSLSKLLYFITIFFVSKIYKGIKNKQQTSKYTIMLGIMPITSIVILHFLTYIGIIYAIEKPYNTILTFSAILLLFSNLFVFHIYEKVQKVNFENTQLYLDKQKSEISVEHYGLLSKEIENSRILIHDIKNHLRYIENKTTQGKPEEVLKYIGTIKSDFGLNERIRYSGNSLLDVIINRYILLCKTKGIKCEIEACCSKLEFMNDSDITALLDNLFDNAIEAAMQSKDKKITFSIYVRNDTFAVISVTNSCDIKPNSTNGKLISSKNNPISHGFGTKSIKRVVNKYDGDFQWTYDDENNEFEAVAILLDKNLVEELQKA